MYLPHVVNVTFRITRGGSNSNIVRADFDCCVNGTEEPNAMQS